MFKRFGLFLCGVCTIVALTSCGEEELGGGIGEFTTVNATAVAETVRLESDLLTGNTCAAGVSTGGTFSTDTVNVDFKSTELTSNPLNLLISRITVRYLPINTGTTPALPDLVITTGQTVLPDETVTIAVPVVPESYKLALASRTTQSLAACSGTLFEYFVQITFEVSEPGGNGKTRNVTTGLNVAIADRTS